MTWRLTTWTQYLKTISPGKRERVARRAEAIKSYLEDDGVFAQTIARDHEISGQTLRNWVKEYVSFG